MKHKKNILKEADDYEGSMAIGELKSIITNANNILNMIDEDTELESWVQSKITKAADYISAVSDYMEHSPEEEEEEEEEDENEMEDKYKKMENRKMNENIDNLARAAGKNPNMAAKKKALLKRLAAEIAALQAKEQNKK